VPENLVHSPLTAVISCPEPAAGRETDELKTPLSPAPASKSPKPPNQPRRTEPPLSGASDEGPISSLAVSVEVVILTQGLFPGAKGNTEPEVPRLKVALGQKPIKKPGNAEQIIWSLPSSLLTDSSDLDKTAKKMTHDLLGPEPEPLLERLYFYGCPEAPAGLAADGNCQAGPPRKLNCVYLALIPGSKARLVSGFKWFWLYLPWDQEISKLTESDLMRVAGFKEENPSQGEKKIKSPYVDVDPAQASLIPLALRRLRELVKASGRVFELMPGNFTLTQLQSLQELILGQKTLAPAFRRKVKKIVEPTGEYEKDKKFRPSRLFRYKTPPD
jgi:hypothetical protein